MGHGKLKRAELSQYGEDKYLTGKPEISFFVAIHKTHPNFAMESIKIPHNERPDFGKKLTYNITNQADIISNMWLEMKITVSSLEGIKHAAYCLGYACIKSAELIIGGHTINKYTGEWMNIYTELTTPAGKRVLFDRMIGINEDGINGPASGNGCPQSHILNIPLIFYFSREVGLGIPFASSINNEIKVIIEFECIADIINTCDGITMDSCELWTDYIYLEECGKKIMINHCNEYLIEQVQLLTFPLNIDHTKPYEKLTIGDGVQNGNRINNCVKELIIVVNEHKDDNDNDFNDNNNNNNDNDNYNNSNDNYNNNDNNNDNKVVISIPERNIETKKDDNVDNNADDKKIVLNNSLSNIIIENIINFKVNIVDKIKNLFIWEKPSSIPYQLNQLNNQSNNQTLQNNTSSKFKYVAAIDSMELRLNGVSRFNERDKLYFLDIQQYNNHTHGARIENSQYYYVYSFGINLEMTQPGGTLNFSNIGDIKLNIVFNKNVKKATVKVYAISNNIMKISNYVGRLLL